MEFLKPFYDSSKLEAGCDEAGRGCLAGPVVCAAVILPQDFSHPLLNDSKQITEKNRRLLKNLIEQNAIQYNIQFVFEKEIEEFNILNASLLGMKRAAESLVPVPELVLVDGNFALSNSLIPSIAFIKGDSRFAAIAAASILAKTIRDDYMIALHKEFPHYNWKQNKGYPTKEHRMAIRAFGSCEHHRKGFNLLGDGQQEIPFE